MPAAILVAEAAAISALRKLRAATARETTTANSDRVGCPRSWAHARLSTAERRAAAADMHGATAATEVHAATCVHSAAAVHTPTASATVFGSDAATASVRDRAVAPRIPFLHKRYGAEPQRQSIVPVFCDDFKLVMAQSIAPQRVPCWQTGTVRTGLAKNSAGCGTNSRLRSWDSSAATSKGVRA
jgi:hypothetical protein